MVHTPHGYRIENGKAVIDETAAERVRALFAFYLSGDSLDTASKNPAFNPLTAPSEEFFKTPDISETSITPP